MQLIDGWVMTWVIIPLLIFFARMADVSIGTLRIVFVSKGLKFIAPLLGFVEILIWLLAMSKIFQNLDVWFYYIAYAGGFAVGNYVGLTIEERLALGHLSLRIITSEPSEELAKKLTKEGYGVTYHEAQGSRGKVDIIYCILKRSDYNLVTRIINNYNPKAFYTIEDVRYANSGVFPLKTINSLPFRHGK